MSVRIDLVKLTVSTFCSKIFELHNTMKNNCFQNDKTNPEQLTKLLLKFVIVTRNRYFKSNVNL